MNGGCQGGMWVGGGNHGGHAALPGGIHICFEVARFVLGNNCDFHEIYE
jgi:hypothetical protein